MKRIRWSVGIVLMAGPLIAAQSTAAMALPESMITVPLAQAVQAPIPVELMLGEPAVVRLERSVTVVTDSPPGLVHPIIHGDTILLVPVREGSTVLAIGLGDGMSAKIAVSIGAEAGARLITLTGSSLATPRPAPIHAQGPRSRSDPAAVPPVDPATKNTLLADAVDGLIATLSYDQRQALVDYLGSPSLSSLSALVRSLRPSQQRMLVEALAAPGALSRGAVQTPQSAPVVATPPLAPAAAPSLHPTAPAPSQPAQADPGVTVSAPAGIAVHVVPTTAHGVLYLSYVLQNSTGKMLRADPHEVEVTGASGPITVRQMDLSTPGEIAAASMETGVIVLTPTSERVSVTWRLRDDAGNAVPVGILVLTSSPG